MAMVTSNSAINHLNYDNKCKKSRTRTTEWKMQRKPVESPAGIISQDADGDDIIQG